MDSPAQSLSTNNNVWKHRDLSRAFILIVCTIEFSVFMVAFVRSMMPGKAFVSTMMASDTQFKVFLSSLILTRMAVALGYFYRFRADDASVTKARLGAACAVLASVGWVVLAMNDNNGDTLERHKIGVTIFLLFAGGMSFFLARLDMLTDPSGELTRTLMVKLLAASTLVSLVAWILMWNSSDQDAYLPESVCYVLFLIFYAYFFYFHTPDPFAPVVDPDGASEQDGAESGGRGKAPKYLDKRIILPGSVHQYPYFFAGYGAVAPGDAMVGTI